MSIDSVQIFQYSSSDLYLLIGLVCHKENTQEIVMIDKEQRKRVLISLLDQYISQENIKIKHVLIKYRNILKNGKCLSEREFSHITPLLVWNMKMTKKQLTEHFQNLIAQNKLKNTTNSLENFFE